MAIDDLIEDDTNIDIDSFIQLFFVAIIAIITYFILSLPRVDRYFQLNIPRYEHRIFSKGLILFVIVFLANSAINANHK